MEVASVPGIAVVAGDLWDSLATLYLASGNVHNELGGPSGVRALFRLVITAV